MADLRSGRERNGRVTYHMSLWLMPEGVERRPLLRLIEDLAVRYGTPRFEPHLTLLGGLRGGRADLERRASDLARRLALFTVRLGTAGYRAEFFRCLFVAAEPEKELLAARAAAEAAFEERPPEPFFPHVGLMYCDLPAGTKEAILDRIGRDFRLAFDAAALHLFRVDGDPERWRRVRRFPLGGGQDPAGRP